MHAAAAQQQQSIGLRMLFMLFMHAHAFRWSDGRRTGGFFQMGSHLYILYSALPCPTVLRFAPAAPSGFVLVSSKCWKGDVDHSLHTGHCIGAHVTFS